MTFYTGHTWAASNRADFIFTIELKDPTTLALVDLTGAAIVVALRPTQSGTPSLTGTNSDGHVTVTGPGTFDTHFTRAEMAQFSPGEVDIGVTVKLSDSNTYQVIAGQVPIVDGVVPA